MTRPARVRTAAALTTVAGSAVRMVNPCYRAEVASRPMPAGRATSIRPIALAPRAPAVVRPETGGEHLLRPDPLRRPPSHPSPLAGAPHPPRLRSIHRPTPSITRRRRCYAGTMCGRYTFAGPLQGVVDHFQLADPPKELAPRYNVAPGQAVAVVALKPDGERLGLAHLSGGWCRTGRRLPTAASAPSTPAPTRSTSRRSPTPSHRNGACCRPTAFTSGAPSAGGKSRSTSPSPAAG